MDPLDVPPLERITTALQTFAAPLTRYALLITGNLELAQDAVQETFLRLCAEKTDRLDTHLTPWLFIVCRNCALNLRRKQNRLTPLPDHELGAEENRHPSPSTRAEQTETTAEILQQLKTLPKNQQEVIHLKFQNGLSYQQISQITNLTVTNVGFLLHTALQTLRQDLNRKSLRNVP